MLIKSLKMQHFGEKNTAFDENHVFRDFLLSLLKIVQLCCCNTVIPRTLCNSVVMPEPLWEFIRFT